jgi:hypothetical protein
VVPSKADSSCRNEGKRAQEYWKMRRKEGGREGGERERDEGKSWLVRVSIRFKQDGGGRSIGIRQ